MRFWNWITALSPKQVAKHIDEAAGDKPWLGAVFICLAMAVALTFAVYVVYPAVEPKFRSAPTLEKELEKLDEVRERLQSLMVSVESEADQTRRLIAAIAQLRKEQEKPHPEDALVKRILEGEQKAQNQWKGLGISFFLGVVSSYIAAVLFEMRSRRRNR